MRVHLPTYMGGDEVELQTDGLSNDEEIVGWIDEHGTILSSKANIRIGDVVTVEGSEIAALIMMRDI